MFRLSRNEAYAIGELRQADGVGREVNWLCMRKRLSLKLRRVLIEVDLKRPGRIDVKIPLFPTTSHRESFDLIRTLCTKRGVVIQDGDFASLESLVPLLLTPGAAEELAVKVYRQIRTSQCRPLEALRTCLTD